MIALRQMAAEWTGTDLLVSPAALGAAEAERLVEPLRAGTIGSSALGNYLDRLVLILASGMKPGMRVRVATPVAGLGRWAIQYVVTDTGTFKPELAEVTQPNHFGEPAVPDGAFFTPRDFVEYLGAATTTTVSRSARLKRWSYEDALRSMAQHGRGPGQVSDGDGGRSGATTTWTTLVPSGPFPKLHTIRIEPAGGTAVRVTIAEIWPEKLGRMARFQEGAFLLLEADSIRRALDPDVERIQRLLAELDPGIDLARGEVTVEPNGLPQARSGLRTDGTWFMSATTGLLSCLDDEHLKPLLAHEMTHIALGHNLVLSDAERGLIEGWRSTPLDQRESHRNDRDMLAIRIALARARRVEMDADIGAVALTGDAEVITESRRIIDQATKRMRVSHARVEAIPEADRTHPQTDRRVSIALRAAARCDDLRLPDVNNPTLVDRNQPFARWHGNGARRASTARRPTLPGV